MISKLAEWLVFAHFLIAIHLILGNPITTWPQFFGSALAAVVTIAMLYITSLILDLLKEHLSTRTWHFQSPIIKKNVNDPR